MNLFRSLALACGRFSRKISVSSVFREDKKAKSTALEKNLLEQMEAKSSFGYDKTVTVCSLSY